MNQQIRVAVGLGSNLGDRLGQLRQAAQRLAEDLLQAAQFSSVYESPPWGPITEQPSFLNAVVVGNSEWKPPAILNYLKDLERQFGRLAGPRYGPRHLDLDLLAYGEQRWEQDAVVVPHPHLHERDFVLAPLTEVWPHWRHPVFGKTALELCARVVPSALARIEASLRVS